MVRLVLGRVMLWTALASVAVSLAGVGNRLVAQEKQAPAKTAAAKKAKKSGRRLPSYHAQVVDQKQREAIYEIQAEYADQIAALKAQLAALIQERDEKIAATLTPEQQKKIEELKAAAKAKRQQRQTRPKPAAPAEKPAKAAAS